MLITIIKFAYLMALIIWIGSIIFFSFFGAPSIFKVLDRELAGRVVGDIFPKYWMIGYICSATVLGTLLLLRKFGTANTTARIIIVSVMIIVVYITGLGIGTKAKRIKAQMYATDDTVEREEIRKKFMKIHGVSMSMNMTVLLLGLITIFITAYHVKI